MGSRKWLGLVASLVLISACYGAMTPRAEYQRGWAYWHLATTHNHGEKQYMQKAVYWFRKAAAQGYAPAESELGMLYIENLPGGVTKNPQKATYWMKKAAEQGSVVDQASLGEMYRGGSGGGIKNYVQAYKWSMIAAAGWGSGYKNLPTIDVRKDALLMTPAQIARAQSMAAAWEKAHGH